MPPKKYYYCISTEISDQNLSAFVVLCFKGDNSIYRESLEEYSMS